MSFCVFCAVSAVAPDWLRRTFSSLASSPHRAEGTFFQVNEVGLGLGLGLKARFPG
uniref:Uncharacterized protein n=1 Tax=Anguilla anguilla TaxID=7936 RepID=A0A0E9Q9T6_ANGAN